MYRVLLLLVSLLILGCENDENTKNDNNGAGELLRV
jgi:hypothetical protein